MITRQSDGRIRFVNQACAEMLGWQESELVGRTIIEVGVYGPERRAEALEQMRRDGGVRDLEVEVTTRLGDTRLALGSILRLELDGEECLVSQFHDMTEHRGLEARLRESEERFRAMADALPQAFVMSTLRPQAVLYASPAVERIFGIECKAVYDDPTALRSLIHPDDREGVIAARDGMTVAADIEFRIVRPDGETRWLRSRIAPVKPERGEAARWVSMAEDVTEERALREALRDSEARFRRLAENSTDVISRASPDAVLRYVSPACRALYGYEPEELIGRPGWEFIHPEDLPALRDDVASRGARPDEVTNVYRIRRKDGSYAWMESKTHTVRDPASGEVIEFHTTARDVGERRRAEAALRRAKREAEEANSSKSEFLSRVSHELRTPLHAILGFGELLEGEDLRPEQRDAVEQMTKGGRHLLDLIDEVLDISAIERGDLKLSLEPVDVGEVIGESLAMVTPLAANRSVTFHAPDAADLAFHVLADRQRLKQALLNLLWNAVKYNRAGGDVRVLAARTGSATARIEVVDTGVGIAAADLARVFTPFERLGAEATDIEGTGLGLALTRQLVEAMGGAIGVDSEPGVGTTFWLELPVVEAPETRLATEDAQPPAAATCGPARTVLYIEDNPSNIKLVERILRRRPEVSLLVATLGDLGAELAIEHRPALVVLDLNLPDISGEEVLRRIRGDARTAGTRVVVVSADATSGQIARLREAGADGYLTKPFEIDEFLAVIDGDVAAPERARRL